MIRKEKKSGNLKWNPINKPAQNMLRRPRRNRKSAAIRGYVRENRLHVDNFVCPLFLIDGHHRKEAITSLPGTYRYTLDLALKEVESCLELGIRSFILFPAIEESLKDKTASYSYSSSNFYLKAISEIKKKFPQVCVFTDVAMDPYSSDGHDGLVIDGRIDNDQTLPILAKMSIAQAAAGADIIGPSDMMDGRIAFLRNTLDANGYTDVGIMSYTVKYASAFYGPFRDALGSTPKKGDKKSYQMDPANAREALLEAGLDYGEGADIMMVKPASMYMDIIHRLKDGFNIPIAAYHVSGECAMILAASEKGWLDKTKAVHEILTSIKRAGADIIVSYFVKEYAEWMNDGIV